MFSTKTQLVDFDMITYRRNSNLQIKGEKKLKKMFLTLSTAAILGYFYEL